MRWTTLDASVAGEIKLVRRQRLRDKLNASVARGSMRGMEGPSRRKLNANSVRRNARRNLVTLRSLATRWADFFQLMLHDRQKGVHALTRFSCVSVYYIMCLGMTWKGNIGAETLVS